MRPWTITLFFAIFAIPFSSISYAADAFGISFTDNLSDLEIVKTLSNGEYSVLPPNPHPEMKNYSVSATSKGEICEINADLGDIKTNDAAEQLIIKYQDFKHRLSLKYGEPEEINELRSSSIWKGEEHIMMSFLENDRSLASLWTLDIAIDPADVKSIGALAALEKLNLSLFAIKLFATAYKPNLGTVGISYQVYERDAMSRRDQTIGRQSLVIYRLIARVHRQFTLQRVM